MPTEIDLKLAEDLAEFRLESEKRFGDMEKSIATIHGELREFRAEVGVQLGIAKWLGVFFASILVAVVVGAGRVVWDAATINAEVQHQGARIEKVEKRLDAMDQKLDTLISRTAPKPGG